MPDRVKEAVFAILGSYYGTPGALPALHVADLFAGSGALGLEALSRGASHCCFFEHNRCALDVLRRNVEGLDAGAQVAIITGNAWRHGFLGPDGRPFELVFLDPPYRDSADPSDAGAVKRYLGRLGEIVGKKPLVVLHHQATVGFTTDAGDPWWIVDQRTIGSNAVTFFSG